MAGAVACITSLGICGPSSWLDNHHLVHGFGNGMLMFNLQTGAQVRYIWASISLYF